MLTLYSMQLSGNSYKVRLLLAHLGISYRLIEVDILKGETRTPAFLAKNPDGHVPVLELESGHRLGESNAILVYLAEGTPFLPEDRLERAEVLRWMFFEQHSHEPALAAARWWLSLVRGGRELKTHDIDHWMEQGYQALALMERHLAPEGDFDLSGFPAVTDWLARVASDPGHIGMKQLPKGAVLTATLAEV
jgi:glutathione S-transferase